jgi:hypothetical protein
VSRWLRLTVIDHANACCKMIARSAVRVIRRWGHLDDFVPNDGRRIEST